MPGRRQRFRLRLIKYKFEILFTPGNQTYLADSISRAAREPIREETMAGRKVDIHVNTMAATDDMYKDGMLEDL